MDARKSELELANSLPEPPEWMPPAAQRAWGRMIANSQYAKCLNKAHEGIMISYCLLMGELEEKTKRGEEFGTSRFSQLTLIEAKLGMTPVDQAKVHIPEKEKKSNKFSELT